ncbi:SPOR domain-containing protein [Candidatus Sororendozoicomonas aggregata]|uniref:SPOR domain-containing protein n=1 Tax=Candidatus Sororendozoicomonas aggregata TaxID=3073239 RepID=UPI002ED15CF5
MPARALFKDKQLRLCVVTTLATGSAGNTTEALLLPPKPLAFSSTWDCQSGNDNDWLCDAGADGVYQEAPESAFPINRESQVAHTYRYQSAVAEQPMYGSHITTSPFANPYSPSTTRVTESAVLTELLNAPPDNYVLQWIAANSREPLERLKAQYPVLQEATIAEYQRAKKQWFLLLDGPYPSRVAAMAALKREPRASIAAKFYPWTRSVASIQQLNLVRPSTFVNNAQYPETAPAYSSINHHNNPLPEQLTYNTHVSSAYQALPYGHAQVSPSTPQKQQHQNNRLHYPDPQSYPQSLETIAAQPPVPKYRAYQYNRHTQQPLTAASDYTNNYPETTQALHYPTLAMESPVFGEQLHYATASTGQYAITRQRQEYQEAGYNQQPYSQRQYPPAQKQAYLPDYNIQPTEYTDYGYNPDFYREQPEPAPSRKHYGASAIRHEDFSGNHQPSYNDRALNVPPGSYTIQWLAANDKASLERVQLRYPALQNTRIVHYRKRNADWYVLIGGTFMSREAAQAALALPPYSRLTARLYPWIRSVEGLQKMVAGTPRQPHVQQPGHFPQPMQRVAHHDGGYTIQWYAANHPDEIRRMQQQFPELSNAVTVHFRRNQRDWYVLLQGQFNSNREAMLALKSPAMRNAARVLHPWTRPVNTLRHLNIQERG